MNRRRALIGAGTEENNHLLFSLENQSVSEGDYFSSRTAIFAAGVTSTTLLDITTLSDPTSSSSSARLYKLLASWDSPANRWAFMLGKSTQYVNDQRFNWMGTQTILTGSKTAAGRHRICLKHQADSNTITVSYKYNNESIITMQSTITFISTTSSIVAGAANGQGLPPGTINQFSIYDEIISDDDINSFFT